MKLLDGIKIEGSGRIEIPDCGRDDLPEFFREMGFKVGAEIGVEKGELTEALCRSGLKMYAIDPWLAYEDLKVVVSQQTHDTFYEEAKKRLAPYDCTIIRKTSMEAVKDFEDGSLDFVYIDANHSFKYIAEDICEWSKKVKKGGVISGHDYGESKPFKPLFYDVKFVVHAYAEAMKLNKWFVLGKRFEGKRDKHRSWFLIKQ